jgi:uncharacterized membrane protein
MIKQATQNQLHLKVVDTISKVKATLIKNNNPEEEKLTIGERFADRIFRIGSKWKSIIVFIMFISSWMAYNLLITPKFRFDPYPYSLMTFILAGIAAIQAPVIMISQHRQNERHSKRIAQDLKVDNEILALHQSITVLMEQQIEQIHENQLLTISLLQELVKKPSHNINKHNPTEQSELVK